MRRFLTWVVASVSTLAVLACSVLGGAVAFASTSYHLAVANSSGTSGTGSPYYISTGGYFTYELLDSTNAVVTFPNGSGISFDASSMPTVTAFNNNSASLGTVSVSDLGSAGSGLEQYETAVLPATTMYVRVTNNAGSTMTYQSPAYVTMVAPSAPTGLTVGNITANSAVVSWNASANATSYTLYDGSGAVIASGLTSTSYTWTGLTMGTSYTVEVSATNSVGEGSRSAGVTFRTLSPPPAPSGLSASNITANSADLSWSAVSGATSYTLYNMYTNVVIASGITTTSYHWTGLTTGTTYNVAVSATNSVGEGAKSATLNVTTVAPPSAPTGLTATGGDGSAALTWTPVIGSGITYNIYRDGRQIAHSDASASYTDSGLTNGTQYSYQVSAVNSAGVESALSSSVTVTPTLQYVAVGGLQLQGGKTQARIQWTGNDAPYTVTYGVTGSGTTQSVTTEQNAYIVEGLTANTDYTVTVTDAKGASVTGTFNSGNQALLLSPAIPDGTPTTQKMLDMLTVAGKYAIAIIGGAVALGVLVWLALYAWRVLKGWLARRGGVVLDAGYNPDLDGYGWTDGEGRLHVYKENEHLFR